MLRRTLGPAAMAACLGAMGLGASEIRVPQDQPSIPLAMKAAVTGDTILVAPGIWKVAEPIHFSGKSVALRGVEGPERTTVLFDSAPPDPPRGSVFILEDGESEAQGAWIDGFTISGGFSSPFVTSYGGGLLLKGSSPRIRSCIITGNRAGLGGGIACLDGAAPTIENCRIEKNIATGFDPGGGGGGVYLQRASPRIKDCVFLTNIAQTLESGGALHAEDSAPTLLGCRLEASLYHALTSRGSTLTIRDTSFSTSVGAALRSTGGALDVERCLFENNGWAGVILVGTGGRIAHSTFAANREKGLRASGATGLLLDHCTATTNLQGGIAIESSGLVISNSIVWDNAAIAIEAAGLDPAVDHSCVEGAPWPGEGNLHADPRFCGWAPLGEAFVDAKAPGPGSGTPADPFSSLLRALSFSLDLSSESPCLGKAADGTHLGSTQSTCAGGGIPERTVRLAAGEYSFGGLNLAHRASLRGADRNQTVVRGPVLGLRAGALLSDLSVTGVEGIIISPRESPRIANCVVERVESWAGIACHPGSGPAIEGCTVRECGGAGISIDDSAPRILNCRIERNHGVGIIAGWRASAALVKDTTIDGNVNGGVLCGGGDRSVFDSCVISRNMEQDIDNGTGGGITIQLGASPTFKRCRIVGNPATGIIDHGGAAPRFLSCTIMGNRSATTRGSAVTVRSEMSSIEFVNCVIAGNDEDAVRMDFGGQPRFVHCTFAANRGRTFTSGNGATGNCEDVFGPQLVNCIVWEQGGPADTGCASLHDTLVDKDPLFERPGVFDFGRELPNDLLPDFPIPDFIVDPGDWRLRPGSPAIDAGGLIADVREDLEGFGRPCGPRVDLGAFERGGCPPPPAEPAFRRGNSNGEGGIDLSDAVAILSYLFLGGSTAVTCRDSADVNDSGLLDLSDAIFLLRFLFLGGEPPGAPFDSCGSDPSEDALDCGEFHGCP